VRSRGKIGAARSREQAQTEGYSVDKVRPSDRNHIFDKGCFIPARLQHNVSSQYCLFWASPEGDCCIRWVEWLRVRGRPGLESWGRNIGTEQSEQFYRNLFDEAPIAFFSIGTDGRIRTANRRALQVLGCQSDEIVGRWFLDLYVIGSAGKAKAWEVFQRFRAGLETPGVELKMRRADGASVWVRLFVRPIRDADGQVVASCSMVHEIGH